MKKFFTPVILLALALGACQKSDNNTATNITTTEAADMVATSLSANANGLVTLSGDVVVNAQNVFDLNIGCGNTKTYTATHQNPANSSVTYSNTFSYTYTLNCNSSNQPDNITGSSTDQGSFDGPRLSATNNDTGTFRVAGLTKQAMVYVINGEYKREGNFKSKVDSKNTSNVTVDVTVNNLVISKSTKKPTSGSATITVTGTTTSKAQINYTGTASFTGDGKATVTLGGTAYIVDLLTGNITKK